MISPQDYTRLLAACGFSVLLVLSVACVPTHHVIWSILPQSSMSHLVDSDVEHLRQMLLSLNYQELEIRGESKATASQFYWLPPNGRIMVELSWNYASGQIRVAFSESAEKKVSSAARREVSKIAERLEELFEARRIVLNKNY